jgi:hypothetical protein
MNVVRSLFYTRNDNRPPWPFSHLVTFEHINYLYYTRPPRGGTLTWNLNDKDGFRVSDGLYLVKYDGTEGPTVKKVVVR